MIGRIVDVEGCGVIEVDSREKGSDMGTYTLEVDATESDAANGVTLKSGDATFEAGDVGDKCTYGGGDITQDKSISSSCKFVFKLIS